MRFNIRYILSLTLFAALAAAVFPRWGFGSVVVLAIVGFPVIAFHLTTIIDLKGTASQSTQVLALSGFVLALVCVATLIFGGIEGSGAALGLSFCTFIFSWLPQILVLVLYDDLRESRRSRDARRKNRPKTIGLLGGLAIEERTAKDNDATIPSFDDNGG